MDFHSITDPYIPSWVKAEVQGTASLFDCNDSCSMSMDDQHNEQQQPPMENNYSNVNNENMHGFPDQNNGGDLPHQRNNFSDDRMPVVEKESNLLWPVLPVEAGEGLPYAPIDWPNPGDTWKWRVGRRISGAGNFMDRFLYPPKHIVPPGLPKFFASKASCENFVRTYFPGADVGAFFASFSWKIPAKAPPKVEPTPSPAPVADAAEANVQPVQEIKDKATPRYSKRERKQRIDNAEVEEDDEETTERKAKVPRSTTPRKRKQAGDPSSVTPPAATAQRKSKGSSRRASLSALSHGENQQEPMVDPIPEDFDNYLNCLEGMLDQPIAEPQIPTSLFEDSFVPADEMVNARHKLISLLQKDFHLFLSSKNFSQLTALASTIRKDPTLTADQLVKLKLIDELPLFSEVYSESRQDIRQVDKFFATLDENKIKVASMKHEYSELKEKVDQLQSLVDSSLMAVQDIDDQMAQLKARRAQLTKTIDTNKAAKAEVSFTQKMVASSIPNIVHDIQVANSKIPEMEMKKINAQKREYEIFEKFASLKGFVL